MMTPRSLRTALLVMGLASCALLAAALAFQYGGGLQPCTLCYWQRWPHGGVIALAGLGLWAIGRGLFGLAKGLALAAVLGLMAALAGGVLHVGVEKSWWPSPVGCTAINPTERLQELLLAPLVACDQPAWTLFSLSMASYHVLAVAVILGIILWILWPPRQR